MDSIENKKIIYFRRKIKEWYPLNGRNFPWRKKSRTKYEIIISEILLQRTRAETIFKYYSKFLKKYPSWTSLSNGREKSLQKILKPMGLWRQRGTALLSLARAVRKLKGKLPAKRETLETLPGVGQYIANAVLVICHGAREPLLDVNMARILERFFGPRKLADIRYDSYLQSLSRKVLPQKNVKEFNWAILDLAALVCIPKKPRCNKCPLISHCLYYYKYLSRIKCSRFMKNFKKSF